MMAAGHKTRMIRIYDFLTRSTRRIILSGNLKKIACILDSKAILDVGGEGRSNQDIRRRAKRYITVNKSEMSKADCTADATAMPFEDASFEAIICTEVMEHELEYQKLIGEIHRVLQRGGVCIASVPFLYMVHTRPQDYFRFTDEALRHVFRDFRDLSIKPMGNRFTVIWDLLCPPSFPFALIKILSPIIRMIFFWDDREAPGGYFIIAKK